METIEYIGRLEQALSEMSLRLSAVEGALTALGGRVESDPTRVPTIILDGPVPLQKPGA